MAKPEAITQVATTSTETSPKETTEITVANGDILVACGMSEDQAAHITIEGGGLTWTSKQKFETASNVFMQLSTAVASEAKSFKVKFTRATGTTQHFWGAVQVWRKSAGVGATAGSTNTEGAPSLSITTTAANSAVAMFSGDWNAKTGAATYRTGAGTFTEKNHLEDGTRYTSYGGFYADAETAAAKTIGMTAPTSQKYTIGAVEIKGEAGGTEFNEGTLSGTISLEGSLSETDEMIESLSGERAPSGSLTETGEAVEGSLAGTVVITGSLTESQEMSEGTVEGTVSISGSIGDQLEYVEAFSGEIPVTGSLSEAVEFAEQAEGTISVTGSLSELAEFTESLAGSMLLIGTLSSESFEKEGEEEKRATYVVQPLGTFHRTWEEPSPEQLSLLARFLNLFRRNP